MTHVEELLTKAVHAIRNLRETMDSAVHALLYGDWGVGKTRAGQEVAKKEKDVFYVKMPEGEITKGKLYKLFGLSMRSGVKNTYEGTLDLMRYHVLTKNLKPIFIVDEGTRAFRKPSLLSELKDLSEDLDLRFSYIFLADRTILKIMTTTPHPIHKRILFKHQLQPITEKTIHELLKDRSIPGNPEELYTIAREKAWTTLEVAFVLSALKASRKPAEKETVLEVAGRLGL